jgi:hypothetical protein
MCEFRLPDTQKRLAVVGSTGSGKTFAGIWHLSIADFSIPWIIFDFKNDGLIGELGATEISIAGRAPKKAGLYVVRPLPEIDDAAITNFLWQVWRNGYLFGRRLYDRIAQPRFYRAFNARAFETYTNDYFITTSRVDG